MGVQSAATMGPVEIASGLTTAVLRLGRTWLFASTGGGIFVILSWLARPAGLPNGRVSADGSPGRTEDGRVIRDFKLEHSFSCPYNHQTSLYLKSSVYLPKFLFKFRYNLSFFYYSNLLFTHVYQNCKKVNVF